MKQKRYTEEQIVYALKQVSAGQKITELCRQMGVSEATFYNWRKKYLLKAADARDLLASIRAEVRRWAEEAAISESRCAQSIV